MSNGADILSIDIFNETINDVNKICAKTTSKNSELVNKIRRVLDETISEETHSHHLLVLARQDEALKKADKMAASAGLPETAAWYHAAVIAYNKAVDHRKRMEYRLKLARKCVSIANQTLEKVSSDCNNYLNKIDNISQRNIRRLGGTDDDIRTYLARRVDNKNNEDFNEKLNNNEEVSLNTRLPRNNGHWSGKEGNSKWIPDSEYIPKLYNEENLSWEKILSPYKVKNIPFKNGKPDFKKFAKSRDVKIENFTSSRAKNFAAFDKKLAAMEGKTSKEIFEYRKNNNLTIHEKDLEGNMVLLPNLIHGNIPHVGGISEIKSLEDNYDR